MIGKMVKFDSERGFGFCRVPCGRQYFIHIQNWLSDEPPAVGMMVEFELGPGNPGKPEQGINIRVLPHAGVAALFAKVTTTKIEGVDVVRMTQEGV